MATVPGPRPDRPLPTPGAPAERPMEEPMQEPGTPGPDRHGSEPDWMPQPYDPERERQEEEVGVPLAP